MNAEKPSSFARAEVRDDLSPQKLVRLESDYDGPDDQLEEREQEETMYVFDVPEIFEKE